MKNIISFPLWFLIALWEILPRPTTITGHDLAMQMIILDETLRMLPVPHGWFETWIVTRLTVWIYREQYRISALASLGAVAVGVLDNWPSKEAR